MKHRDLSLVGLCLLLASVGCGTAEGELWVGDGLNDPTQTAEVVGTSVRLMAANLTAADAQNYDSGEGTRIFQGIGPDIVMIQEFKAGDNSAAALRDFVDTAFGPEFVYVRESGKIIPNGIISRYPVLESGSWDDPYIDDRSFVWARLDIPGDVNLWVVSVHFSTSRASTRAREAEKLVAFIQANMPADDYLVVGGDLNTSTRGETALTRLSAVVQTKGPYPVDGKGNGSTNRNRRNPYDWVLVDSHLEAYKTPVAMPSKSFPDGLVVDTRVYTPIEDLAPALKTDSGASRMQHMAVVRDFLIPEYVGPASVTVTSPNGGEELVAGAKTNITWRYNRVDAVNIEYAVADEDWLSIATDVAAVSGTYRWTLPATPAAAVRVRISATVGSVDDVSDAPFALVDAPPALAVFINEVLADEPGTVTGGEFVELVNGAGSSVDLSGWTVSDKTTVRHQFADGTTIASGGALVVMAAASAIPEGLTHAVAASTGGLGLANGGDVVTLCDASGLVVSTVTFGGTVGDGISINREPDGMLTGGFVPHSNLNPALKASPGTRADGSDF